MTEAYRHAWHLLRGGHDAALPFAVRAAQTWIAEAKRLGVNPALVDDPTSADHQRHLALLGEETGGDDATPSQDHPVPT